MEIRTFSELIDWTRQLHSYLATCMTQGADRNQEVRAKALLEYLGTHEAKLERIVAEFEKQADQKALQTYIYDYLRHKPIKKNLQCEIHYGNLDFDEICSEVFEFHEQIIQLYRTLKDKADIPEIESVLESLLELEEHEAMQLAMQTGRMADL